MRRTVLLLLAVALLAPSAGAKRRRTNQLLRVVTPTNRGTAPAHPFVNVVVRFGSAGKVAADPATFRASIGRRDITSLFAPETDAAGTQIGMRARLDRSLLHVGRHANRLRLVVQSRPPVAHLLAGTSVIFPGVPIAFDGSQSSDPDADTLTYHWDFGDGTTSSERSPT